MFDAGVAVGVLPSELDLFAARMLAFGAMNWNTEWFDPARRRSADQVADTAVLVIMRGRTASRQLAGISSCSRFGVRLVDPGVKVDQWLFKAPIHQLGQCAAREVRVDALHHGKVLGTRDMHE